MNLLKALATVSGMTLLSRILGFVRDFIIARIFGAGAATDAFFIAFRLPNLLRRLFAEGAFSQAFVPILGEYRNQRSEEETRSLIDHVASALFIVVLLITLIGMIATPLVIYLTAPGYSDQPDKFALTVSLTRVMFPYILCMSLVAMAAGILNTWSRFTVPAFTPVLLNLAMIGGSLLLTPYIHPPVMALAVAVVIGGALQLAIQIPALKRIGMMPRFRPALHDPAVRRVLKLMAPAVVGVSVSQISLIINTVFASFLASGSVSWIYYADRLMEFPAGLLGAALGTILLPSLSRSHAKNQPEEFSALLDWGLRLTLLLTLPAALGLGLLAVPLLSTLFQHGAFTAEDVLQTRKALLAYSLGLTGLISVKILAPAYYSRQDIRTPVKIALITLAVTQLMNLIFVFWLRHAGLALATGLASCLNAYILLRGLRQKGVYLPRPGWGRFIARLGLALSLMAALLWFGMGRESDWLAASGSQRLIHLALLVSAAGLAYLGTLYALGFRIKDFIHRSA